MIRPQSEIRPKLLVVDDDPLASKVVATIGEMCGFDTTCIQCPEQLDTTALLDFKVIALDLLMPETDGIQWLRLLARLEASPSIILISRLHQKILNQARITARNYGQNVTATIQKPVMDNELRQALQAAAQPAVLAQQDAELSQVPGLGRIKKAFLAGEFDIVLQPQIDLQTGAWCGNEVLTRWHHPQQGLLGPGTFIEQVEKSSLALPFTLMILEKGLAALSSLKASVGFDGLLAVNVPPSALTELDVTEQILALLDKYQVDPERLVIEITERSLPGNLAIFNDIQTRLAMRGIRMSVDDFGTGHSGIERLHSTLFNELKIDHHFTGGVFDDAEVRHIVQNMIQLGHDLGMKIVAEGIEDKATQRWLQAAGCDTGQGFHICRPLPLGPLTQWARSYQLGKHATFADASNN
jgi:EAL domain-containing protein (putative c-di-GMP-specific phosphodiesterase class I)